MFSNYFVITNVYFKKFSYNVNDLDSIIQYLYLLYIGISIYVY